MNALKIFQKLEKKLGNETAALLVDFIKEGIKEEFDSKTATKQDLAQLKTDLISEMKGDKFDLVKWMFVFWIGQAAMVFALLKYFA